jgi:Flp pilus assembly protein TadG
VRQRKAKWRRFLADLCGATAVEFAFTAPVFLMLVGGSIEAGLLLYTQVALQHGAEAAARCGSIDTHNCATTSQIQAFAVTQSFGLSVPASTFTVTTPSCGTRVAASTVFPIAFNYFGAPTLTLTAASCFPK